MKLHTITYADGNWSESLPDLDSPRTLVVAFCAPGFVSRVEPIRDLVGAYPRAHIVGCSTSGEIFGQTLKDDTVAVAVARFDKAALRSASAPVDQPNDSYAAGRAISEELSTPDLRAVFVLSDGLSVNGTALARGLNECLPDDVVVTGGLAGDADRFESTWVIVDGQPSSGRVTAVGLYGNSVLVGHGSRGGWDIFGPQRRVTRSEGSVLYELDGRPALALYKEYLGELADGLPATGLRFPLLVETPGKPEDSVVRTILAVDEETQSLTYAGDIPEGSLAQLMRANFDRLIDGAGDAALNAGRAAATEGDTLSVDISCVGRRLVLGERCEEEIEAVCEGLLPGAQHIGFYSYGELSPVAGGTCDLHNQTMTITTFSERAA